MTVKETLDATLRAIPENEFVFIRASNHGIEPQDGHSPNEVRNYILRWGGFQNTPYSVDGSEAHLYSQGEILRLIQLSEQWNHQPTAIPVVGQLSDNGKKGFALFSVPEEIAIGKDQILVALSNYKLDSHKPFFIGLYENQVR